MIVYNLIIPPENLFLVKILEVLIDLSETNVSGIKKVIYMISYMIQDIFDLHIFMFLEIFIFSHLHWVVIHTSPSFALLPIY